MANVLVISETPQRVIIRDEAATRTVKVVALGPQGPSGNVNPLMFEMLDQANAASRSASISATAAGEHYAATSIRADEAEASAASALASQQSSTTSAESAAQSAASASASANTAISSASSASLSASSANASATNAQASANTATTKASEAAAGAVAAQGAAAGVQANSEAAAASAAAAAASQSAAAASESSASGSATSASASASASAVSATNAAGSATSAGNSATAAAASATTASTKAGEASASAASALDSRDIASVAAQFAINAQSAAQTSANAALASKNAASASATDAANSATASAGSATAASGSATSASGSASTATTKASEAATSATNAAASATTASTKASEASTSATNAAASAAAAATSATNTANALVGERSAVATLTNKTITGGTTNPSTLQEGGVAAVVQTDIGTAPNQIPLNQYLGPLAFSTDSPNLSGLSLTGPFASRVVNGTVLPVISSVIPPELKYTTSPNAGQIASGYYFNGTFVDDRIPAGGGAIFANGYTATLTGYALDPAGRVALNGSYVVVRRNNALDVGANANPSSYLGGYRSIVQHAATVPSTVVTGQAYGTSSTIACQSGTIVEATGFNSVMSMPAAGGTAAITNARGIYTNATVGAASGSQTIGSYYDAYLDGVTVSGVGAVTSKYGVYQTKADHINYFAGDFLIGRASKVSGGKLEVAGNLVCQPSTAAPTLGANGDMTFQLLSDTSLKILVRGSDGVTRSTTLTLA